MARTAWWIILVLATAAWSGEGKPELRVDPGTHNRSVDTSCLIPGTRLLATLGVDGTVRAWDTTSGEVVKTVRLREADYTIALAASPDGRWLAAATEKQLLALYEVATFRLRRVVRLPAPCSVVSFSPDSSLVASVGFDGGLGIAAVETGAVQSLVEMPEGMPGHRRASSVAWSPDGRYIATGHNNRVVLVRQPNSRATLTLGTPTSVRHLSNCVGALAWQSDSKHLLARAGATGLVRWEVTTGVATPALPDLPDGLFGLVLEPDERSVWATSYEGRTCQYSLLDRSVIRTLPEPGCVSLSLDTKAGLLAAGLKDGGIAVFDTTDGTCRLQRHGAACFLGDLGWGLQDGSPGFTIQAVLSANPPTQRFNLRTLALEPAGEASQWRLPQLRSPYGVLSNNANAWTVDERPDGKPRVDLGSSPAVSWLSSGQLAVVRSSWLEILRPGEGPVVKRLRTCGAERVIDTADGRYALGGGHCQTLRIWPLTGPGFEVSPLLSIFPATNGNWIAWTEEGYYACTPAAEKWIGWQVNRADDVEPEYYPATQFREQFYRPDVIQRLLDCGSVAEAVQQADTARKQQTDTARVAARITEFAPPRVEILAPADGATVATSEVTVRLRVKDPNHRKVVALIPLVNGRPLTGGRFVFVPYRDPSEQQVTVPLTPGENTISAIATNDAGSHSVPVSVTIRYGAEEQKPAMYVLAVGVSAYANKDYTLRYAAKDATDLANVLQQQAGKLFRKVEVKLLTDQEASQGGVLDALEWLTRQVTQRDYAVVFLAGHGLADSAGEYYFLPSDGDTERLRRTGLHWSQFRTALRAMPGKVLLALDTCHSAGATGARKAGGRLEYTNVLRDALSDEVGLITLSSCMPSEVSYEQDEWHNGAFTKALVEALSGQADHNGDGVVTLAELDAYISERVKALTKGRQHATCERPATVRSVLPVVMVK